MSYVCDSSAGQFPTATKIGYGGGNGLGRYFPTATIVSVDTTGDLKRLVRYELSTVGQTIDDSNELISCLVGDIGIGSQEAGVD